MAVNDVFLRADDGDGVNSVRLREDLADVPGTALLYGLRATTAPGVLDGASVTALTGLAATTAWGVLTPSVRYYDWVDTFTDTNGTLLTAHTPDSLNASWSTLGGTAEPSVQTNRLRSAATGVYTAGSGYTVADPQPWYVQAVLFRRNTTGTNNEINGISARCNAGVLSGGPEGFFFGWNENGDYWEFLRQWAGAFTSISTSTTGAFTGSSQSRTLEMRVSGAFPTISVECYVDGVSVFTHTEAVFQIDLGNPGIIMGTDSSVDIEGMQLYGPEWIKLTGQRITTAQGEIIPNSVRLTGLQAVANAGVVSPTGAGTDVALTGLAATTTPGTLKGWVSVGIDPLTFTGTPIFPEIVATKDTTPTFMPGVVGQKFIGHDGTFKGVGEEFTPNATQTDVRAGVFEIAQGDLIPWTDGGDNYNTSSINGLHTDRAGGTIGNYFPFNGVAQSDGHQYNFTYNMGGFYSHDPSGNIHVAHVRNFAPGLPTGLGFQGALFYQDFYDTTWFLAWQKGDIAPSANYQRHPLVITRGSLADGHRVQNRGPLGIYALSADTALAFYPRQIDGTITGVSIELNGCRAVARHANLTAGHTSANPSIPLEGFRATTAAGVLKRLGSESGVTVEQPLTGIRLTAAGGELYGERPEVNIVPALRPMKYGLITIAGVNYDCPEYGAEIRASTFTGATRVWALQDCLTVVPTGFGDLAYAVYASTRSVRFAQESESPVTHIGVVVFDASTGEVHSNTLYPVVSVLSFGQPGTEAVTRRPHKERPVAQVVTLSDGRRVTQFLMRHQIVHVEFTSATRLTPTVTLKAGPTLNPLSGTTPALLGDWETLEVRFDKVYHVLFVTRASFELLSLIYTNDITTNGNTWTELATDHSGTDLLATGYYGLQPVTGDPGGEYYSGYGGRKRDGGWYKSWLYLHRWDDVLGTIFPEDNATVWIDFFKNQPKVFSVPLTMRTGRVKLRIDPNVTLTGLAATTSGGQLYTAAGTLVGLRANTAQGQVEVAGGLTGQRAWTFQGVITAGGVVAPLTGLSVTTAQGVIFPAHGVGALTGLSCTLTAGTLEPPRFGNLVGYRAYTAQGYLVLQPQLLGFRATALVGVLVPTTDDSQALTGLAATTARGAMVPVLVKDITGHGSTTALGVVTPTVVAVLHTGHQLEARAGAITRSVTNSVALTGLGSVATHGNITPTQSTTSAIGGQAATATHGNLSVVVTRGLAGTQATARAGTLVPLISKTLTGQVAVSQQGVLAVLTNIFLTGRQGVVTGGNVGVAHGGSVQVAGVKMALRTGTIAMPGPRAGAQVWVTLDENHEEVLNPSGDVFAGPR